MALVILVSKPFRSSGVFVKRKKNLKTDNRIENLVASFFSNVRIAEMPRYLCFCVVHARFQP